MFFSNEESDLAGNLQESQMFPDSYWDFLREARRYLGLIEFMVNVIRLATVLQLLHPETIQVFFGLSHITLFVEILEGTMRFVH